jgi:glycosyltransferase involved in cell wall biosynthesis
MPYHPDLKRQPQENGVKLRQYHYVPFKKWNIWGYAASLEGDVKIRKLVYLLLPFVLVSSFWQMWKLTRQERFAMIQAHWVIPNAPVAVLIGLLRKIPVVISLHGSDVYVAERLKPVGWVARWAFRRAAAVTASSGDLLERAQRLGATTDPTRAVVIPYGADPAMFSTSATPRPALRQKLGFAPEEQILFCIGRLVYKKGFEYAIKALPAVLEKFPGARLVIAGQGDLRAELEAVVKAAGVAQQVTFAGNVPHNKVPEYLAGCDLFLLPSIVDDKGNVDGLPNTLLEAMAAGVAVVASNVAGVPLAVADGVNGRLVPQRNPSALAQAICELLADPAKRASYGQTGRLRIEQELNWANIARRYEEVFINSAYAGVKSRS